MHVALHIKCTLLVYDFNQTRLCWQILMKLLNIKFYEICFTQIVEYKQAW